MERRSECLDSIADEAVWVGDEAPEADEAAAEGLAFRFFVDEEEDEDEAEDILRNKSGARGRSNGAQ